MKTVFFALASLALILFLYWQWHVPRPAPHQHLVAVTLEAPALALWSPSGGRHRSGLSPPRSGHEPEPGHATGSRPEGGSAGAFRATQTCASFARRAREARPRAVLFWGDAEQAGALIDALPSPKPAVLFIGDGYRLSRLVGPASAPLFYVTPFDLSQRASPSADFMAKYQGPKEMAGLAAVGYRAARAILDAASAADVDGQHDRAAVQKALDASIGDAGPVSARDFAVHIFHLDGTPYPGRPV